MSSNKSNKPSEKPGFSSTFLKSNHDWLLLCAVASLCPLLYFHALNLWAKPHFQFFPLAWFFLVYLVVWRSKPETTESRVRLQIAISLWVLALATTAAAVLVFSPWLAHVSLALVCLAWMLARLGAAAWHVPLAWVTLLLITLPMPRNLDTRMVQQLQTASTGSASSLMDLSGIPHFASGNVIEIRTGKLFVDEACSGVDSLYSLAAISLLLTIWFRKSLVHGMLMLLTVPFWAWLGNVFRLYIIAFMLDRFGTDWSHGWEHTLLGLGVFAFSFANLLLTQRAIEAILSPFMFKSVTSGVFHKMFNTFVCWPGRDPASSSSGGKKRTSAKQASQPANVRQQHGQQPWLPKALSALFLLLGTVAFLPILGVGPWKKSAVAARALTRAEVEQSFAASLLPHDLDGAKQVGFRTEQRERASVFGEHSAVWEYRDGEKTLLVSLDFPFQGFHGLEECYVLTGNQQTTPITVMSEDASPLVIYEGQFTNQLLEKSHLFFAEFEQDGTPVTAAGALERGVFAIGTAPVTFQTQIYVQGVNDLTDAEKQRYADILAEIATTLLPTIRELSL